MVKKDKIKTEASEITEQSVLNDNAVVSETEEPAVYTMTSGNKIDVINLSQKVDVETFTAEMADDSIAYVQPDYTMELSGNTVMLNLDLSENAQADDADDEQITVVPETEINTDNIVMPQTEAVVAVLDSGIDITHPDLVNRVQDGWDFVNDAVLAYDSAHKDEYYHGTHVAGIIANNADCVKIMPLKVFEGGKAYTSDIIDAIEYAEEKGASVVNMSFGSTNNNQALLETMQQSSMTFVCAAGNNRRNLDEEPVYPACFELDNIISVGSVNADMGYSYYSNYGTTNVDIAAVGRDVVSTFPEGEYGEMSGTSIGSMSIK